jgi:murein hydrolase activator
MRFRLALCLIIGLNAHYLIALGANKDVPSRQDLKEIQAKIAILKKELSASQSQHAEAADHLKQSEVAISEANRKLRGLQTQHRKNETKLKTLDKQKTSLQSEIETQKALLSKQLVRQYTHGKPSFLQIALQQENADNLARELHYFSYVSKARSAQITALNDNIATVEQLNTETNQTLQEISSLKTAQEKEKEALELQKKERNQVLKALSSKIATQRNEINKLKRDEKQLTQLFEKLAALAKKKTIKKPTQKSAKTGKDVTEKPSEKSAEDRVVANNDALPDDSLSGSQFAALRGKLRLPVRGEVTNRFGSARPETGVTWKGLFIRATEGSEVKSVASGRVVFADWMRGFGNLLIVDHGGGYMSLYGNNQSLYKQVGENVAAGDTVAAVGNTGGNASNGLYYELRKQSRPFDPLSWSRLR